MSKRNRSRRDANRRGDRSDRITVFSGGTNEECISRGMEYLARRGVCELCGGPPDLVGLFVPTPSLQRRLGAPPGKDRLVPFTLCRACRDLPDAMDRVDAAIVSLADSMADQAGLN